MVIDKAYARLARPSCIERPEKDPNDILNLKDSLELSPRLVSIQG